MTAVFGHKGVLLTRRGWAKPNGKPRSFGGCWECGAGGKIEDGETAEMAARAELWEELGLADVELRPLAAWASESGIVYFLFVGIARDEPQRLDGQLELAWAEVRPVPLAKVRKQPLVPSFERVVDELRKVRVATYSEARRFVAEAQPSVE